MATTGRIHSVETLGGLDGPGLRMVVFLQGCLLRCNYCHNPDTWSREGGTLSDVESMVRRIKRCQPYFRHGGGVTFSGGEPLLQPQFTEEVFAACRAEGIHTALDTSGAIAGRSAMTVLDHTDLVLLDVKDADPVRYRQRIGGELAPTLDFLAETTRRGIPVWIRHVVVTGCNDTLDDLRALADRLRDAANIERVDLLPYHTFAAEKYTALGCALPLDGVPALPVKRLAALASEFRTYMPQCLVTSPGEETLPSTADPVALS